MPEIRLSPTALDDLRDIKNYIESDLSNPVAARNTINRIINDYTRLKSAPKIGSPLSAKLGFETDFRYITSGNYMIIYKEDNKFISIFRILYARRDYLKIIFDDLKY